VTTGLRRGFRGACRHHYLSHRSGREEAQWTDEARLLKGQRRRLLVRDVRAPSIFVRRLTRRAPRTTHQGGILHSERTTRSSNGRYTTPSCSRSRRSTPKRRLGRRSNRSLKTQIGGALLQGEGRKLILRTRSSPCSVYTSAAANRPAVFEKTTACCSIRRSTRPRSAATTASTPAPCEPAAHRFVPWLIKNVGPKFYLIGSNYIYPRRQREVKALLAKHAARRSRGIRPTRSTEFSTTINKIRPRAQLVFSDLVAIRSSPSTSSTAVRITAKDIRSRHRSHGRGDPAMGRRTRSAFHVVQLLPEREDSQNDRLSKRISQVREDRVTNA